jgi:hypothetical protein
MPANNICVDYPAMMRTGRILYGSDRARREQGWILYGADHEWKGSALRIEVSLLIRVGAASRPQTSIHRDEILLFRGCTLGISSGRYRNRSYTLPIRTRTLCNNQQVRAFRMIRSQLEIAAISHDTLLPFRSPLPGQRDKLTSFSFISYRSLQNRLLVKILFYTLNGPPFPQLVRHWLQTGSSPFINRLSIVCIPICN